ncbi:MAG: peptidoglycan editing factor PgeF [Chloroflexi bacterium]|uniref:Purine nucleoside phosphorylase n=1 Tax=Candidatus Chlorohelix allophototropha TaxID=3003348 RepID=A0A8T7M3J1_9CHLR|nr:peptidoglycan editing factor PgeF [Chloroflexota bacterium]WJW67905.1 peptidoglycan editing factor PgeF [Chloroflexota bacterium L227-S17]
MPLTSDNALNMPLFKFETLSGFPHLKHGISTRYAPANPIFQEAQPERPDDYKMGGVNAGLSDEVMNLRRSEFIEAVGGDWREHFPNLTSGYQQHTANVAVVDEKFYGAGRNWRNSIPATDALVTNLSGIPLLTGHADCPPILFYDPIKGVIAAAHSGWRGTVQKIAAETVQVMQARFGCDPTDILAGIGPSIGGCCYTVNEAVAYEVFAAFGEEETRGFLSLREDGLYLFNLWSAIEHTLRIAGIKPAHIEHSELCSLCHHDTFFSYRAQPPELKGKQGNYGALIMLD